MVVIDIGNNCHHRLQIEKRRVTFVRFSHEVIAKAKPGMPAGTDELATNHVSRIDITPRQHTRNQTGGGGLAMGSGNRNAAPETHQLGQHFGTPDDWNTQFPGCLDFRIVSLNRS